MAKSCHDFHGLDTAAQSREQHSLQLAPRLRQLCAGITFEGRVALSMKMIPLTRGMCAMVDDEDYEFLNQWKWRVLRAKRKQTQDAWYAYRSTPRPNRKSVLMHREVLRISGVQDSPQCDHIDADGLNNQRHNLRSATASQNRWNMRKRSGCTSKFKGVYWHRDTKRWMARIGFKSCYRYLGTFESETDAGKAYDVAARRQFGEFARLNFP